MLAKRKIITIIDSAQTLEKISILIATLRFNKSNVAAIDCRSTPNFNTTSFQSTLTNRSMLFDKNN
ncbi:MAG: hypothetical protein LBN07_04975 [Christensenellaceae bacterium]|nr:hypothetical protein [Christensenellaceae bacterium]